MPAADDGVAEGGPDGPSERGVAAKGLPVELIRHLTQAALELTGELTPSARIQVGLRNTGERQEILEELCREVCPSGVDPVLWSRWLAGGKPPFVERPAKPQLKKPTRPKERPANLVSRTTSRVVAQEEAVAEARARLEQEEEYLLLLRAHDNAAVHFLVINQLVSILEPIFAMGPGWTIMRAVSGHLPAEVAEFETGFLGGKDKEDALARVRAVRTVGSEKMHEVMDFFSGIFEFEEALRAAVEKVCKDFDKRRGELVADGRRVRSKADRDKEVHPKAQSDAAAVLAGLKLVRPVNRPVAPIPGVSRGPL